ncbi:hypothetical protein PPYR_07108 [Photinus pyralis]|uniref:Uncharacterized protein n=1 Tax=Photinus pyralis TaxID=7054 RepID=A0A1Y1LT71_PHOPY|nr:uncharacterized protein LOC116167879 [Photinus pyralis]KAB0799228.1 hypothetical protein PPYR_07108 [Photinus pyralis]
MSQLEIKKMKQGMSYSCKEKTIILNVFKYFRINFPEKCVTDIVRRTSKATGCSEKSIFQFRKEEASVEGFKEPSKTKIRKNININSRDIKYDNNVRQTIRNIIYDLKYRNIVPSLNTILKHVNADNHLPNFSLMTLRRLMFDMGFYYEKNGNKSILAEKTVKQENNLTMRGSSKIPEGENVLQKVAPIPHVQCTVPTNHLQPPINQHLNERVIPMAIHVHENHIIPPVHAPVPHGVPVMLNHRKELMPLHHHGMIPSNMDPHLKRDMPPWMNSHNVIKQQ